MAKIAPRAGAGARWPLSFDEFAGGCVCFGRSEGIWMLTGYNTNIGHQGVNFHIQTEDSGRQRPHIMTHLFHGGTILASEQSDYSDLLESESLEAEVKVLMEAQHKEMLRRLSRGDLDTLIGERLGAEVFPG